MSESTLELLPIDTLRGDADQLSRIINVAGPPNITVENIKVVDTDYLLFASLSYDSDEDSFIFTGIPNINEDLDFKVPIKIPSDFTGVLDGEYDVIVGTPGDSIPCETSCVLTIEANSPPPYEGSNHITESFYLRHRTNQISYYFTFVIEFDQNRPLLPNLIEKFITARQGNLGTGTDLQIALGGTHVTGIRFEIRDIKNLNNQDVTVNINVPRDFNLVYEGQTQQGGDSVEIVIPDPIGMEERVISTNFRLEERVNNDNYYDYEIKIIFLDGS